MAEYYRFVLLTDIVKSPRCIEGLIEGIGHQQVACQR